MNAPTTARTSFFKRVDWLQIGLVLALAAISVYNLHSSARGTGRAYYIDQLRFIGVGLVLMFGVAMVDYRNLQRFVPIFYGSVVLALIMVLILGKEINGSKRWLDLGLMGFQPSELAKIAVILTLASWFQKTNRPGGYTLKDLLPVAGIIGVPMILILQEPDLGHTLMVLFISCSMLAYEKFERRTLVFILVIGICAAPLMWSFGLRDYQRDRILTLIDGRADRLGSGWHAQQSRVAVGSGQLFGKGHSEGTQVAGGFLPESHTDFAFANLAEEHGFVGGVIVLGLYLALILNALRSAALARDRFAGHVAVGVAALIFWQVIMNMGMVLNLLPVTGVTLPLLSYGGTSVLTILAAMGLVVNINLRRTVF